MARANDAIDERVLLVVKEELNLDEVKVTDNFEEDLNADSLDTIEIVMALEEEFGIEIPDDDAIEIKTVQQAIEYIQKKIGS